MFCEGFKPDLIKQQDYWKALSAYLEQKDRTLKVLVNSDAWVAQDPLQTLFKKQLERGNDNTIQVRLITDEGRNTIRAQFNGAMNNFAVFDTKMYRLEYNPNEYKAFGSFNNPDDAELLLKLFNNVFENSKPLSNGTAS